MYIGRYISMVHVLADGPMFGVLGPYISPCLCLCVQMCSSCAYSVLYISICDFMHGSIHKQAGIWYICGDMCTWVGGMCWHLPVTGDVLKFLWYSSVGQLRKWLFASGMQGCLPAFLCSFPF